MDDASDMQSTMDILEEIAADASSVLTDRRFILSFIARRVAVSVSVDSDDQRVRRMSEITINALIAYLKFRDMRSSSAVVTMLAATMGLSSNVAQGEFVIDRTFTVSRIVDVCDGILDRIFQRAFPSVAMKGVLSLQEAALANEIILLYL